MSCFFFAHYFDSCRFGKCACIWKMYQDSKIQIFSPHYESQFVCAMCNVQFVQLFIDRVPNISWWISAIQIIAFIGSNWKTFDFAIWNWNEKLESENKR